MAEMSQAAEASTQATEKAHPVYEVGFHLLPSTPEEGLTAAMDKIRALLGNAEIISDGFPTKMTLAYTIERAKGGSREKFTQAYFGWIKFSMERSGVEALQEKMRGMGEVLRFILIETVRDTETAKRAVFSSDRLEGKTLEKHTEREKGGQVSEEELDKSIESLTG